MTSMEEQVCLMVIMHFRHLVSAENLDAMSCAECADFKQGDCQGEGREGRECIACMEEKAKTGEVGFF